MKRKHAFKGFLTMASLTALLASGAAAQQSATPPKPAKGESPTAAVKAATATGPGTASSQRVVLKVGATQVRQSQIDALVSQLGARGKVVVHTQGLRPLGEEYVKMLLLSRRALDEHLDQSPALRSQLEFQRDQTLAEAEYQKMASEVKASPEEVSQYFNAHRSEFDSVQVREFLIRKRPQGSQDLRLGFTAEEAKAKAEAIRKALQAGTDVEKVAMDFATPNNTVMLIDRKPRTLRRDQMQPVLAKATFDVKDGGVSEPVDSPQAFMVVKVFGHQHPELKEVAPEVEAKVRQQKLDSEISEMQKKAGVWMDDDFFGGKPTASATKN
jgi:peptidyl-prolyl cis-trans isomerase C